MSKPKKPDNKKNNKGFVSDAPPYINENVAEENELKFQSEKDILYKQNLEFDKVKKELREKENELTKGRSIYEKKLDEITSKHMQIESELAQMKRDKSLFENKLKVEAEEKIAEITDNCNKQLKHVQDELDELKEKNIQNISKKKHYKEAMSKIELEKERIESALFNSVKSHKEEVDSLNARHQNEIEELKIVIEDYKRANSILDSDIYQVYNDIKEKFEDKLKECMEYKNQNERIVEDNKNIKISLDNSESIMNEISKMQYGQTKLMKQYKESLDQANKNITTLREENRRGIVETKDKFSQELEEKDQEITRLKHMLKMKNDENVQLRSLSQMILDQRSDIEQYFIECLEDVKVEIYKKKKELDRKQYFFPSIEKKYEEKIVNNKKIDIKELTPEDKEKVLRLLFAKINENYKPKTYKDFNIHDI